MTLPPDHPNMPASDNAPVDESQVIREQLQRRINASTHPSRLINRIALADVRSSESARALAHLIGRSPRVLAVIRGQLREAFGVDPDRLLFTESGSPGAPQKVDSLTERALLLLVRPSVVINVNQFTVLSVRGEPGRWMRHTPLEVLRAVIAMRLFERLAHAVTRYWDTLAEGSWQTRRERWEALYTQGFADRAIIARELEELSSAGMAMVQALIDAPTHAAREQAGGDWAGVRVALLKWPGTPGVVIPGALHIFRQDEPGDAPHVLYLPGAGRNFYESPSFAALECGLRELDGSRLHHLWQCLPLTHRNTLRQPAALSPASPFVRGQAVMNDALALGAQALLGGQWSNELACAVTINHAHVFSSHRPRPPPLNAALFLAQVERARQQLVGEARLGVIRDQLLEWDHQRRRAEIIFASTGHGLALYTAEHQVKRHEKGLVALLTADDPGALTPAYAQVVAWVSQLKAHTETLDRLMLEARPRLFDLDFWAERPGGTGTRRRVTLFLHTQMEALRCEVQLQHGLKLLGTAHRDLMIEVIEQPLATRRSGSQTQVLSIAVGSEPDAFYPLHNLWVVTTAAAVRVPTRQLPVVLYAFGRDGGVTGFQGLGALTHSLKASLNSRDDSVLWGGVERDKRPDLRAHAAHETLAVRYVEIKGKPALAALKKLLGSHYRLYNSTEDIHRIFTEVSDAELSRSLLEIELEKHLKFPLNSALALAQANVDLVRETASEVKHLPAWLATATSAQRKQFKRLKRRYLNSAFAFKSRLEEQLLDLGTFARRTLVARLVKDGFTLPLDVDRPLLDMPDDVRGSFCSWEASCAPGDRKIVLTPSQARTTFSLLQLTLHNLDPLAPWTRWRLNRARYVQPEWRQRLHPAYLISMVSSLDIGGQYDALINQLLYPPAATRKTEVSARIPELLNRTLQAGADLHLFSALQWGLSAAAQRLFKAVMEARTPDDMSRQTLDLHVVHLVGHTMLHDRYVAGIVVMRDTRTGLCVVYWPQAPQALVLTEYDSLQRAHDELNRIGALAENVKVLARQVAPGWAFEAITHPPLIDVVGEVVGMQGPLPLFSLWKGLWQGVEFVRSFSIKHLEPTALLDEIEKVVLEQIASDPLDWLAVVPTSQSDVQALLYRASVLDLQRRTQAASNSGKALQAYRNRRLEEQSDARGRRLVAFFFPVIGVFNDAYELLLTARHYHRYGDPRDAVDVGFMASFMIIDLLLSFMPGPKAGSAAARSLRPTPRSALGRMHRLRMTAQSGRSGLAASPVNQLKALERFKIKGRAEGAVALGGPGEKGLQMKNGELFVADDAHLYPVYRRGNETSYRLKNPQAPGQNELILNIRESGEWLLGADAPQPVAGTRSGVLNPWRPPVSPPPDWWPPIVRGTTENAILQSSTTATHWLDWRLQIPITEQLSSPAPGVFHVPLDPQGFSYNALRVAPPHTSLTDPLGGYYRLLPQGDQAPLNRIVFITKNEPRVSLATLDIEHWTLTALDEQPIPASRTATGGWQLHAPLFDRPLATYVAEAFPGMAAETRKFTVARMVELTGPKRPLTATHLLNIRATLDNWFPPAPARPGQTDDLLRMLRPIERPQNSTAIGFQGAAPGFNRVDFVPSAAVDRSLQHGGKPLAAQRDIAQRAAVRTVLEEQGFTLQEFQVRRHGKIIHEAVATHPNSPSRLYYVSYVWLEKGYFTPGSKFTERWFAAAIKTTDNQALLNQVGGALREQRLVRIMAGIQWPVAGRIYPTVYFVKLTP